MSMKKINDFSIEAVSDFVEKYLVQIIYTICFCLLLTFLVIFYGNFKENKKTNLVNQYYQAISYLNGENEEDGLKLLKEVYDSEYASADIKSISGLKLASELFNKEEVDKSLNLYLSIYKMKKKDIFLRNLAGLNALNIMINQNDKIKYSEIEKMISEMSNPNNPLILLTEEQSAMFEIQKGNVKNGVEILKNLLNQKIDQDTAKRINTLLDLYENI